LACWRNAIDLAPKDLGWEVERAETELEAGRPKEARERLDRLLSRPEKDVPQSIRDRARKVREQASAGR
jgi:hypothetical protein